MSWIDSRVRRSLIGAVGMLFLAGPGLAEVDWTVAVRAGAQSSREDMTVRGAEREIELDYSSGFSGSLGLRSRLTQQVGLAVDVERSSVAMEQRILFDSGRADVGSGDLKLVTLKLSLPLVVFDRPAWEVFVAPMAVWTQFDELHIASSSPLVDNRYEVEDEAGFGLRVGVERGFEASPWVIQVYLDYFEASVFADSPRLNVELNPLSLEAGIGWRF